MTANPVAENVFGTIGTICWTVQLVPQVWKSWRTKSTDGLSEYLMLLWGISCVFLGVYAIVQNLNVPLIVQPQIMSVLSYTSWAQCQYYGRKRSKTAAILMGLTFIAVSGGFEAGMVFAIRPTFDRGNTAPVKFFGIVSTVLLSCGLLPQYYEIYRYKEVIGVSLMFMFVDMMGGVFSDLSLAFKERFDVIAGVAYSLVVVLDGIVLLCALILNPRAKRRRKQLEAVVPEERVEPVAGEQGSTAMQDVEVPPSTDQVEGSRRGHVYYTFISRMVFGASEQSYKLALSPKPLLTLARPYDMGMALLPQEILDHIVACLLSDTHSFSEIAAVSLASYGFRQVAFRKYFATLEIRSAPHCDRVCKIAGVPSLVRQLKISTSSVQFSLDALSEFTSLLSFELDFFSDGLSTQSTRCLLIFKSLSADLTTLKLTFLPRIDTALLSLVASHFPSLTTLELSSIERLDEQCCWLCFQESASCIVHSPIPDTFPSVDHLARSFGKALQPLKRLEHLFLGIFLSDADVLISHFDRCASVVALASPRTGFYSPPPFGPNGCVTCVTEHAAAARERERLATGLMGNALPPLKTIGWGTFFSKGGTGDGPRRETTFCVRTLEEKAELRR